MGLDPSTFAGQIKNNQNEKWFHESTYVCDRRWFIVSEDSYKSG